MGSTPWHGQSDTGDPSRVRRGQMGTGDMSGVFVAGLPAWETSS